MLTFRGTLRRFYGVLNMLGLYNKEAKILFLVRPSHCAALRLDMHCAELLAAHIHIGLSSIQALSCLASSSCAVAFSCSARTALAAFAL